MEEKEKFRLKIELRIKNQNNNICFDFTSEGNILSKSFF